MIDIEEIKHKKIDFEKWRNDNKSDFSKMEELRKAFLRKFPPESLQNLPIERYVVGQGNKDTFCYWLETRLKDLGNIKGGTTAGNKFGIYFGVTKSDKNKEYRFPSKYGSTKDEAYEQVQAALVELLDAGKNKDYRVIQENLLSPMFKGKILATYYPDNYLNVFSREHVRYFLIKLGIPFSEDENELFLREKLITFKNADALMRMWTNVEYGYFLYDAFKRPAKVGEFPTDIVYDDVELPALQNVKPKIIDPQPVDITTIPTVAQKPDEQKNYKPDYIKQAKRNTLVGNRGEEIVLIREKENLVKAGRKDLADKIEQVSAHNDGLGYDIHSFTLDGQDKFIEVKSTTIPFNSNPSFIISEREYKIGCELQEKYHLYWVFKTATEEPEILDIQNPFGLPPEKIVINPRSYTVGFQFNN